MSKMEVVDPVLKWFWKKCRAKLAQPENQRKSSWQDMTLRQLMKRLNEEKMELQTVVDDLYLAKHLESSWERNIRKHVISEATDVANFAMMIADKARLTK